MKSRDKAIIKDLCRFRCLSRDDIIDLHFQGLKKAVTSCNTVMKRLRRDGSV
ncbi:replication-relaxation family protein, partial [Bacillus cereus]